MLPVRHVVSWILVGMVIAHDKQIFPVMIAYRDALHAALECSPLGPVDRIDLIPRDRRDMRGCECDRSWIRWANTTYIDAGAACTGRSRIAIEVGIIRCLPYDDTTTMPDSSTYFTSAEGFLGDAAAIRRALRDAPKLRDARIDSSEPYGPQASCMGTVATISWLAAC